MRWLLQTSLQLFKTLQSFYMIFLLTVGVGFPGPNENFTIAHTYVQKSFFSRCFLSFF